MNSNKISKGSLKQFKVTNHGCCFAKNVTHYYLVCQMCRILLINDISKNYDLKYINDSYKNRVL